MNERRPPANPVLQRLDALVGGWDITADVPGMEAARVRAVFEWLPGGAFLIQHADMDPGGAELPPGWAAGSPFPVSTVIGLDDSAENFTMLYGDGRGVYRVYEMTLDGGVWTLHRDAPGFCQRFTGTFSADGGTIATRWEKSVDGIAWELDFDSTYTKI